MDIQLFIVRAVAVLYLLFMLAATSVFVYIIILIIKALRKYIDSKEVREEKQIIKKSLGTLLKENRLRCKMTQEFVAESLGVSRQAVSKWENGTTDPSTSNLIALAQLYEISAEELLKDVNTTMPKETKNTKEIKNRKKEKEQIYGNSKNKNISS